MSRFYEDKAFSESKADEDKEVLRSLFPGCTVWKNETDGDDRGIDYVVEHNGRQFVYNIDVKRRRKGCSQYWQYGCPEIALETDRSTGNVGFILNEEKQTDLYLFLFDWSDSPTGYLINAKWLRDTFKARQEEWERYRHRSYNGTYWSEFYAVPMSEIFRFNYIDGGGYCAEVYR